MGEKCQIEEGERIIKLVRRKDYNAFIDLR